jgi:hypothetical protein
MTGRGRWLWITSAVGLLATPAAAEEAPAFARLRCRPEAGPGRVLCELEVGSRASERLAWADGLVVESPEFAAPLRARIGKSQASAAEATRLRLPIALAATTEGQGTLSVTARWVVCSKQLGCRSGATRTSAEVRVGSVAEP